MNLRVSLFIVNLSIYGLCPIASFADNNSILLTPNDNYSYCTPYTPYGKVSYSLGVVGKDWALTFEDHDRSLSGRFQTKGANFYRGPNMHVYIGRSAGPVRPTLPETEAYSKVELTGVNVDVQRIKIYDKVMGPIEVTVDDFTVNDQQYHIPGRVKILCMGPLP